MLIEVLTTIHVYIPLYGRYIEVGHNIGTETMLLTADVLHTRIILRPQDVIKPVRSKRYAGKQQRSNAMTMPENADIMDV